ncbi:MAG: hypothetical protein HZC54_17570 [Verrucomicrobia bacterium]|nr:hypothetical protein [Verrucomicrobiota bacterium]
MAETPSTGDAAKQEKKDTVRITLPPRPVPPSAAGAAPAATAGPTKLPATVAAMPVIPKKETSVISKKETSRLKKTTGNVPGATRAAAPVVPPPTVRAQPVGQVPSTVAAAAAPPPTAASPAAVPAPSSAATAVAKPTVKLQTADIPKIPSPPTPSPAASAPAPIQVVSSGPTLVDAILSFLVMVVSGLAVWLLLKAHLG